MNAYSIQLEIELLDGSILCYDEDSLEDEGGLGSELSWTVSPKQLANTNSVSEIIELLKSNTFFCPEFSELSETTDASLIIEQYCVCARNLILDMINEGEIDEIDIEELDLMSDEEIIQFLFDEELLMDVESDESVTFDNNFLWKLENFVKSKRFLMKLMNVGIQHIRKIKIMGTTLLFDGNEFTEQYIYDKKNSNYEGIIDLSTLEESIGSDLSLDDLFDWEINRFLKFSDIRECKIEYASSAG